MATPFQAFIQSVEQLDAARFRIISVVTDGQTKAVREVITSSLQDLTNQLRGTLFGINSAEELKTLTPGQEIDLSLPTPTAEETAEAAFLLAYGEYQSAQRKVACGLLQANDPDVASALSAALKAYTPAMVKVG